MEIGYASITSVDDVGGVMTGDPLVRKLTEVTDLLQKRRTSELFSFLANPNNDRVIQSTPMNSPHLPQLVVAIAQAVDLGCPDIGLLQTLIRKLPPNERRGFADSLARGVLAARRGKTGACLFFRQSLSFKSVISKEHLAFVRYCLSNALRKRGEYSKALQEIVRARRLAVTANLAAIVADFTVAEGWLYFQLNQSSKARELYDQAEAMLRESEDHRRLADIASGRGRIEQRAGRLNKALKYFRESLAYYDLCPVPYRGRGRTLINLAKTLWLQARQLRLKMHEIRRRLKKTPLATCDDAAVSLNRVKQFLKKRGQDSISVDDLEQLSDLDRHQDRRLSTDHSKLADESAKLLHEAHDSLEEAKQFYTTHPSSSSIRGLGREMIIRCYLYIEERDWPQAMTLAGLAFLRGKSHSSRILKLRASIADLMARVQQLWHSPQQTTDQLAVTLQNAQELIELSNGMEDRRLVAKAHTWSGLAQLLQSPPNIPAALASIQSIKQVLFDMPNDYVTEDADLLKRLCEEAASQPTADPDVTRLSELLDNNTSWEEKRETIRDFLIARELRRNDYRVARVARLLHVHARDVRPVRDRLVKLNTSTNTLAVPVKHP